MQRTTRSFASITGPISARRPRPTNGSARTRCASGASGGPLEMASNVPARRLSLFALLGLLAILGAACLVSFAPISTRTTHPVAGISGEVRAAGQPVPGALVRYKGKAGSTRTDALGRFSLPRLPEE